MEGEADCWKIIYEDSSLSTSEVGVEGGGRLWVCVCVQWEGGVSALTHAPTSPAPMTVPAVSLAATTVVSKHLFKRPRSPEVRTEETNKPEEDNKTKAQRKTTNNTVKHGDCPTAQSWTPAYTSDRCWHLPHAEVAGDIFVSFRRQRVSSTFSLFPLAAEKTTWCCLFVKIGES